ncbi:glycosyltransferase family 4 protein [Archaeoglobus neptunius]|uniref:glycosyltransferase family 4 protein n=1 Tax=Archaeoglobus neptunius TaxID=2798580 RepID=UPI0019286DBA|nr:glycosyltransferase family 4 protein [Archaeoglobus neptunius]
MFVDSDMELMPDVVGECVEVMEDEKVGGVVIPERSVGEGFWVRVRDFERGFYAGTEVESARGRPSKIALLLDRERHPYEGVVRPFINWAKEFSKNGWEVHFLLLNCEKKLTEFIESIDGIKYKNSKKFKEIVDYINIVKPNIILTDDNFRRLRLLKKIKSKIQIKTGVYVQILFGVHSIVDVFDLKYLPTKERILFKIVRVVPFNLLKASYKKLLQKQDILIANSQITATLLHTLYGVEPHGIVYPPVNTEIFKPQNVKKKDQVLLYLGSHAGDTDENFVKEICKVLEDKNFKILAIGNKMLAKKLSKRYEIHHISGVSDKELAKIYSECKLAICPQKWEQFGYVIAESIACGTPVLVFNVVGAAEIVKQSRFGFVAYNSRNFLEILEKLLESEIKPPCIAIDKHKLKYSIENSTQAFIEVLKNVR